MPMATQAATLKDSATTSGDRRDGRCRRRAAKRMSSMGGLLSRCPLNGILELSLLDAPDPVAWCERHFLTASCPGRAEGLDQPEASTAGAGRDSGAASHGAVRSTAIAASFFGSCAGP